MGGSSKSISSSGEGNGKVLMGFQHSSRVCECACMCIDIIICNL